MQNKQKKEQVNTRLLVMEMLLTVTSNQEYSHIVIREVLNKYNYLSMQEKSFMKRLFEGTLERMIELDYCINQFSKVKVSKMKPVIQTIMRMGVYQILYMDAVPDAAACNEAVKLAQKKGFATLKGFVNGVLRNIARNKAAIAYPDEKKDYGQYLSVKYSMPQWIVSHFLKQQGKEKTEQILQGLLTEHPVTVRFRKRDEACIKAVEKALLEQGGSITKHPYLDYAYQIEKTDDVTRLPGYAQGDFVIQDVSSMLAIEAIGIEAIGCKEGMKILDICAAPGGKTMLAADKLKEAARCNKTQVNGQIEARDVSDYKVDLMQQNFDRCGMQEVSAVVWDALDLDESWVGQADVVIADLPCSGLGIIGKKRDIKYKMSQESMDSIIALQEEILANAVQYVKPGGKLLFSTCTINQQENEEHVKLLKNTHDMTPVSLQEYLPEEVYGETVREGYVQLLPGIHQTDGFFISVFEKNGKV